MDERSSPSSEYSRKHFIKDPLTFPTGTKVGCGPLDILDVVADLLIVDVGHLPGSTDQPLRLVY